MSFSNGWVKGLVGLGALTVVLVIGFLVRQVGQPCTLFTCYEMNGNSMIPSFAEGDQLVINESFYQENDPQRGDVVLFQHPNNDLELIKRIVGLPNDVIKVDSGVLFINDVPLNESYIQGPIDYDGVWEVPADHYFVLGDNRNASSDSHSWGSLPADNIKGRTIMFCLAANLDDCRELTKVEY